MYTQSKFHLMYDVYCSSNHYPPQIRTTRGQLHTSWLCNINEHLSSFGMELTKAREAAQNRPFWRMFAKHSAMHL